MKQSLEQLREEFRYEKTNSCVQCGYCLPVCPTYITMGKETHSPRGRINLVKMVGEGKITDLSVLEEPLDLCLGCRACETACPTGVEYGSILEAARAALVRRKKFSAPVRLLRKAMFQKVFPNRKIMKFTGNAFWLYEKSGLQKAGRTSGAMKRLPNHLGDFEAIMPQAVSPAERKKTPNRVKAKGEKKYTVAFFTGCIMDAMFQRINRLSVQLLAEAGCEVIVVPKQTCCGALHSHSGEMEETKRLAKQNITAFEQAGVDFIVNNAGGCGAMLYEYGHLLEDDKEWADRAAAFSAKSRDISQVLVSCGGLSNLHTYPGELVTYQRSCHMTNVQKVTSEPLDLLNSVSGIRFIEMEQADMCCGSAGIYNIINYDASMDILDRKMKDTKATGASVIITTNPGCLLQMKLGIEREKLSESVRAMHLIEYLAEAAGIS
ncbi:(Fe-S)-binding protein [Peribacillus cavernae]|uniref:Glycolate oxidase iron-sulfur subunit n=1 Tax=Peribacillus cavernae TaxID=1674310 RepID=A0A3S0VBK4_9BACI|nr:(Fe-S)-binding protein [Peribacillus cavernae]MDQ0220209.1 glycolate oxidase iron-sulfur subunit [Peribacillus cavernae]RUQ28829.1 (Fe-S)-binding protein [Peribacillus cavernae]